jgi:hypothetical protein
MIDPPSACVRYVRSVRLKIYLKIGKNFFFFFTKGGVGSLLRVIREPIGSPSSGNYSKFDLDAALLSRAGPHGA